MLKIGLTGGIGSGKTAVSNCFAELGVPIIDADVIARRIVKAGLPAYFEIVAHFGKNVLQADNEINRGKLRELVFSNKAQRSKLESILHPMVRSQVRKEISMLYSKYCIVVIPLLLETRQTDVVDKVVVVDVPLSVQIERTMQRDKTTRIDVEKIINAQVDRQTRQLAADYIIENSGSLVLLKSKVEILHQLFLDLKITLVDNEIIEDNNG